MAKINLQGRTFERCCQRFSRELGEVFKHPDCPERIRDLIQLFSNEIREEYLPLLSVEEQAKEIRFGTLTGLVRLTKEPPEEITGKDAVTLVTPIEDGLIQDKSPEAFVLKSVPASGSVEGRVSV